MSETAKVAKGISLPADWWAKLDQAAAADGLSRSEWVRARVGPDLGFDVVVRREVREVVVEATGSRVKASTEEDVDLGF